ncbi:hypothetical protein BD414DRAFT_579477 [Trametes punicea]|nr:hypothetical protein BD414DRAFT_579477 [Trametes punicea]
MFGLKHIHVLELAFDVQDSPDTKMALLVITLAVLIVFMTYYVISHSIELYRIIAFTFHNNTPFMKTGLPSLGRTSDRDFSKGYAPLPIQKDVAIASTSPAVTGSVQEAEIKPRTCLRPQADSSSAPTCCVAQGVSTCYRVSVAPGPESIMNVAGRSLTSADVESALIARHDMDRHGPQDHEEQIKHPVSMSDNLNGRRGDLLPHASAVAQDDHPLDLLLLPSSPSEDSHEFRDDPLQPSSAPDPNAVLRDPGPAPSPPTTLIHEGSFYTGSVYASERLGSEEEVKSFEEESATESSVGEMSRDSRTALQAGAVSQTHLDEERASDGPKRDTSMSESYDVVNTGFIMRSALHIRKTDAGSDHEFDSATDADWIPVDHDDLEPQVASANVFLQEDSRRLHSPVQDCDYDHVSAKLSTASERIPEKFSGPIDTDFPFALESVAAFTITVEDVGPPSPSAPVNNAASDAHLALPRATDGGFKPDHPSVVPTVGDSADVYIGPLPTKPPRVRKHTPEDPDWAVAPDEPNQSAGVRKHRRGARGRGRRRKRAGGSVEGGNKTRNTHHRRGSTRRDEAQDSLGESE